MKKTILTAVICVTIELLAADTVSFAKVEPAATTKNKELCTLFQVKAAEYKKSMRDDDYAKATLASYEQRVLMYCEEQQDHSQKTAF